MPTVSIDLAYKSYDDIGFAVLRPAGDSVECEFHRPMLGVPDPIGLAAYVDDLCKSIGARRLLVDGPQGWKLPDNGDDHARVCERALNTPAKTGLPGTVKPGNYAPFVKFSIALFENLVRRGWRLPASLDDCRQPGCIIESFPLSAWRSLKIAPLPAKRKARAVDIIDRLEMLRGCTPVKVSASPTHDELQALVSGLAGVAMALGRFEKVHVSGRSPIRLDETWREGYIFNPT